MSFEKIAKENIKKLCPEAYVDKRFAKRVKGAFMNSYDEHPSERLNVVPDCYFHFWYPKDDAEGGVDYFIVCEVEDTNPLTKDKLEKYGEIWDRAYNNLEVWSFNRYGQFTTSHCLSYWYLKYCLHPENVETTLALDAVEDQLPSIHINMRKPLFPNQKEFWDRFENVAKDNHLKYKPASKLLGTYNGEKVWCQERKIRLFKNYDKMLKQHNDWHHAEDYWQKYGKFPAGYEEEYKDSGSISYQDGVCLGHY